MKASRKLALFVGGVSIATSYTLAFNLVDIDLQIMINQLCKINGGQITRRLDRDNTSKSLGLDFLLRSDVDGGLDAHHAQLKLSQLAYYAINLKLAQWTHPRHYITMVIECRQDSKSQQPGKLSCRATFYVSEAQYRQ